MGNRPARRRGRAGGSAALLAAVGGVLFAALSGCVTRRPAPPVPGAVPAASLRSARRLGEPFDVVAAQSQLIVLVYRAGPLAAVGHDHLIACHCLSGTVYLPADPLHASFDVRIAVKQLTVDDPKLRAAEHNVDFPPDIARSARRGTREHMLGPALLDAARFADIRLRSQGLRAAPDGKPGDIRARVAVRVLGRWHPVSVPMHYVIRTDEIRATGAFPLRQTDIGLTPYSLFGGALRVKDRMRIRITLVARRRGG
jgi:hypothetical protein